MNTKVSYLYSVVLTVAHAYSRPHFGIQKQIYRNPIMKYYSMYPSYPTGMNTIIYIICPILISGPSTTCTVITQPCVVVFMYGTLYQLCIMLNLIFFCDYTHVWYCFKMKFILICL